jgi:hypothetical protein
MRRFTSIALVVAVLLTPATMYAGEPVRNLLRKVFQPVHGVYKSVGGPVRTDKRSYGSTGTSYGSSGSSASYGSTGTPASYGSTGTSVGYGSTGK